VFTVHKQRAFDDRQVRSIANGCFPNWHFFSQLLFLICHVGQRRLEKMGLCIATVKAVSGGMLLWKAIMGCLMDK